MGLLAACKSDILDSMVEVTEDDDPPRGYEVATYEFLSFALSMFEECHVSSKDEYTGKLMACPTRVFCQP